MSEYTGNAVMEAILSRRSIRSYQDTQLTEAELKAVLDAGIWAPTARNQQEVNFYVLQDRKTIDLLSERYSSFTNKEKVQDVSFGAPTLILLYARAGARFLEMDAGIAVENISIAAQSLGLGSLIVGCFREYMESDDGLAFSKSICVPEDFCYCISIALGHTANTTKVLPRRDNRIFYV